ncbi:hypothetical protein CNMCM8980_007764 [Aspergillus fumigatiaffinis]|nr:hypothetical protein CNMCM8980_007764 [Aspergillus fumigatiaffinis]
MPQRKPISTSQKAALRAQKRLHPNATQKDLRKWFQETYDHTLSSGLISDILSRKYDYLDADSLPTRDAKRQRRENWPELENALFEWIIRVEEQIPISAEIIRQKAQSFWEKIYPGQEMPTFSNGWLHNFQTRRQVIQNCFQKALDSQPSYREPVDPAVLDDIQNAFSLLKLSTPIQDLMDIDTFLNPAEEAIQDTPEDIESQILAQYGPELDDDSEEELEILPQISLNQALEALRTLRLYEEQQAEGIPSLIYELDKHERILWGRKLSLQTQRDIRSYFTG